MSSFLCLLFSRGRPTLDLLNFGLLNWLYVSSYCVYSFPEADQRWIFWILVTFTLTSSSTQLHVVNFFQRPTNVGSAKFANFYTGLSLYLSSYCVFFSEADQRWICWILVTFTLTSSSKQPILFIIFRGRPTLDLLNFGLLHWPRPLCVLILCLLFFQRPTNVGSAEFWSPLHWPQPLRVLILCLLFSRGRPTLDLLNFGHLYTDLSLYGNLRVSIGQSIFGKCINKVEY